MKIKNAMKGRASSTSPLRKFNQLLATGHIITVINTKNNSVKVYNSIHLVTKDIGVSYLILLKYINNNELLKNTYKIIMKTLYNMI